jgi:hypothetical protein
MKPQNIFVLFCIGALAGCNIDPRISERDYPIIRTLGSTEVNQTGASIEFEIVKDSKATITSYGVEYFDLSQPSVPYPEWVFTEEISGKPSGNLGKVRLQYDLLKNENYIAVPFVKISGKTVFGEPTTFTSLGTKAPIINEISVTRLSGNHLMTIKGDFFSYENRFLSLNFSGLEEFFRFNIQSVSPKQIEVFVELRSSLYSSDKKYDFILSVNGQQTVVKDAFEIGLPRILSVSPLELNVGETFQFELDVEAAPSFLDLAALIDGNGTGTHLTLEKLSPTLYRSTVPNVDAGDYKLALGAGTNRQVISDNTIKVKSNWIQVTEDIPIPDLYWRNFQYIVSGGSVFSYVQTEIVALYRLDFPTLKFQQFAQLPDLIGPRSGYAFGFDPDNRTFYYGLGGGYDYQTGEFYFQRDIEKFEVDKGIWEPISDFPTEGSSVIKFFKMHGKMMTVMTERSHFVAYDPILDKWQETNHPIPPLFRNSNTYAVDQDKVYFLGTGDNKIYLYSFSLGTEPELLATLSVKYPTFDRRQSIVALGENLYISNEALDLFEYNKPNKTTRLLQRVKSDVGNRGKFYILNDQLVFGLETSDFYGLNLIFYQFSK